MLKSLTLIWLAGTSGYMCMDMYVQTCLKALDTFGKIVKEQYPHLVYLKTYENFASFGHRSCKRIIKENTLVEQICVLSDAK